MKITFWGVRGSFPVSSPDYLKYGGNTPCVEVEAGATTFLLDAGTGIRAAGQALLERGATRVDILLSHPHWDHVQGFPHCPLLFCEGAGITIRSLPRPGRDLREIFDAQQRPPFFPIPLDRAKAELTFADLTEGQAQQIGAATVTCHRLNHPGVVGGFRIEHDGAAVAYICDADVYGDLLLADDLPAASAATRERRRQDLQDRARDLSHRVDLLVCDTFFLPEEYQPDWGHSRPDDAIQLARAAGARCVALFHHRPGRTDSQLDALLERYRAQVDGQLELVAAREGMQVTL